MRVLVRAAAPIFISLYFLALTARAVQTFFSPDDLMNIYQAWSPPWSVLLKADLLFFTPSALARPLASTVLRSIYSIAGFHPTPFKVIHLAILVANIFLTYAVARRLAKSGTAGTIAALLAGYHGQAIDLYLNTAYIFDVLCYFFYFAAALVYLQAREGHGFLSVREWIACCGLYVCALNSKEMAVTLPVFILIYELLYHGLPTPGPQWRRIFQRWSGVLITGTIAVAAVAGRVILSPTSLIRDDAYHPRFTWHQFMLTSADFSDALFLAGPTFFTPALLVILWVAMLAVAWVSRSRALRFAWWFVMLSPLPIAFIFPRGLGQYYIPLFGWALYAGALVEMALSACLRRFQFAHPVRARVYAGAGLAIGLAMILFPLWRGYHPDEPTAITMEAEENRSLTRQLHRLQPSLPHASRLMFLNDPVREGWWSLMFLVRLSYRDLSIQVDRGKLLREPPSPALLAAYDHVFDFHSGYFFELATPWRRDPTPMVILEQGRVAIFHARDFTRVDRLHPARPGEELIVKASDLGPTIPPLPPGGTFPEEPFAKVIGNVAARVYSLPGDVGAKRGWPGETNVYRVDVRLPSNTPSGMCWMELSLNGVAGPAVEFPVR